jgi:nicotinate-nucleotide pyrophosphorylase (carboxylating)
MKFEEIDSIIEASLKEDIPDGDITSESIIPADSVSQAVFLAKEEGVLAGIDIACRVFKKIDPKIRCEKRIEDGSRIRPGDRLADLSGNSIALLKGERTALNFLQRMSGIASLTRKYVQAVEGFKVKILDTRKTTPLLRRLEKYAVRMGGGSNHRFCLSDMVMIKDNHLQIAGSLYEAVKKARESVEPGVKIEVEAATLEDVRKAVQGGADIIMLDNMTPVEMRKAVVWVNGRVPLEASGNVQLSRVREIAATGVNFISIGGLTHSFESLDVSLEFL